LVHGRVFQGRLEPKFLATKKEGIVPNSKAVGRASPVEKKGSQTEIKSDKHYYALSNLFRGSGKKKKKAERKKERQLPHYHWV